MLAVAAALGVSAGSRISAQQVTPASREAAPVAAAVQSQDVDAVRDLLKRGIDVNAAQGDGMTALHWAAMQGNTEIATMLLYAGANVRATTRLGGYTPLHLASQSGAAALIDPLIKAGGNASARTDDRRHPADAGRQLRQRRRGQEASRGGRRDRRRRERAGRERADVRRRGRSGRRREGAHCRRRQGRRVHEDCRPRRADGGAG